MDLDIYQVDSFTSEASKATQRVFALLMMA